MHHNETHCSLNYFKQCSFLVTYVFHLKLLPFQVIHEKLYDEVLSKLKKAYEQVMPRMGDPLDGDVTMYSIKFTSTNRNEFILDFRWRPVRSDALEGRC